MEYLSPSQFFNSLWILYRAPQPHSFYRPSIFISNLVTSHFYFFSACVCWGSGLKSLCLCGKLCYWASQPQNVNKKDVYICLHACMYTACVPGAHEARRVCQMPWNWVIDCCKLFFFFWLLGSKSRSCRSNKCFKLLSLLHQPPLPQCIFKSVI